MSSTCEAFLARNIVKRCSRSLRLVPVVVFVRWLIAIRGTVNAVGSNYISISW